MKSKLTQQNFKTKDILLLWLPLALSWFMMSFQCPMLQSYLGKLPQSLPNLAAFGIIFSLSLFFEGFVIPIFPTCVTLVKNKNNYSTLLRYTICVSFIIAALFAVLLLNTTIFNLVIVKFFHLNTEIKELVRQSGKIIIFSPLIVAYRRFFQGILLLQHRNKKITFGTLIKLITILLVFLLLINFTLLPSAVSASCALISGYVAETFYIRASALPFMHDSPHSLTYHDIINFHLPLALMTIINISGQPLLLYFISKGKYGIEALALYPILANLVFLFSCPINAMQELIIQHADTLKYQIVRRFHFALTLLVFILMLALPAHFVLQNLYGLPEEITQFAKIAFQLIVVLPLLSSLIIWKRSTFMVNKNTLPITIASYIELATLISVIALILTYTDVSALISAFVARIVAKLSALIYLSLIPIKSTGITSTNYIP